MDTGSIFDDFRLETWALASRAAIAERLSGPARHVSLVYGADADGFVASYFVERWLADETVATISHRAVWNFDYDFRWLPRYVRQAKIDTCVCLDVPVIQEPEVLRSVATDAEVIIYDHHVLPPSVSEVDNVQYHNSRISDPFGRNLTTSGFAAFLASLSSPLLLNEVVILAAGLYGDRALGHHPLVTHFIRCNAAAAWGEPLHTSLIGQFAELINALFRAKPGTTPPGAQARLRNLAQTRSSAEMVKNFSEEFDLTALKQLVSSDIARGLHEIRANERPDQRLCARILEMETFSVGPVASILAAEQFADVVAIGFPADDRVQFELRAAESSDVDLTAALQRQRLAFQPITSGGHPKAAGALVWRRDATTFVESLSRALRGSTG
jgi:single-stranded DNA-specific DHH superfamily exonuclease